MARPTTVVEGSTEGLEHLNAAAVRELDAAVDRYAQDLLREAERLEANQRSTPGAPEITSTMISDADTFLRRSYTRQRRSRLTVALHVASYAGAIGFGLGTMSLDALWGQVVCVASAVVGIVSVAVAEARR
jgi:hypothetical protein